MSFVDFAALKEKVKIEDVCQTYDLKVNMRGVQGRGPCQCGHGGDRALAVNTQKQSAYCFGARQGGDFIWLISHVKSCSQREAAADIAKQFSIDSSPSAPPAPESKKDDYLEALRDMIDDLEMRVGALEEAKVIKLRAT